MKDIQSKYSVGADGEFSIELTGTLEGDGPSDFQALQIINHLLSSLPGCNQNDGKGNDRKNEIMGKWKSFRELQS